MKKFWQFRNVTPQKGELTLYGEISDTSWWGDEVTPADFQRDLKALGDIEELNLYVNSPGGDVFAGFTIYNQLKRHSARKIVHVDGLAASAASVICMAGDEIIMPENASMMIHEASAITAGNKAKMRKMADELERIDGQIAGIYAEKTGKKPEELLKMMEAETWMNGAEALEQGFCTAIEEAKKVAACVGRSYFARYSNVPADLLEDWDDEPEGTGEEPPADGEEPPQPVTDKTPAEDSARISAQMEARKRRLELMNKKMKMEE